LDIGLLFIALVFLIILGITGEPHHFSVAQAVEILCDLWNYNQDSRRRQNQLALARRLEQSYSMVPSIVAVPPLANPKRKATPL
jgi:hypothetical protein